MNYKISGPVNVTRLVGEIGGINKVIYLFMDAHYDEDLQTLCSGRNAIDIKEYLTLSFEKLNNYNKTYDFLVEFEPNSYLSSKNKIWYNKNIYLHQVLRFFKKFLIYDTYQNQIWMSEYFRNVRFHYLDIRRWLEYFIYQHITHASNLAKNEIDKVKALNTILELMKNLKEQFISIKNYLENPTYPVDTPILVEELPNFYEASNNIGLQNKIYNKIKYLINKLIERYNDPNIKEILNRYIKIIIIPEFYKLIDKANAIHTKFTGYNQVIDEINLDEKNKMFVEIENVINQFWYGDIMPLLGQIMDIYFLRRFLDKDYITNAIVFVGAAHAAIYIAVLVNLFNFKITHTSISITTNINDLNKSIKKFNPLNNEYHYTKIIFHILKLLKLPETNYIQCSDVSTFPENFN